MVSRTCSAGPQPSRTSLWVFVLVLGLDKPWRTISTMALILATLLLLTIVVLIHRRIGKNQSLPRAVVWQWWLGPWDPVGRLVWLPVRLPEAAHALVTGRVRT